MVESALRFYAYEWICWFCCHVGEAKPTGGDSGPGQHQPGGQPSWLHPPLCHLCCTAWHQMYRPHTHGCRCCGKGAGYNLDSSTSMNTFSSGLTFGVWSCMIGCRYRPWNVACCPSHQRLCPWAKWPIMIITAYWWMKRKRTSCRKTLGLTKRWWRFLILNLKKEPCKKWKRNQVHLLYVVVCVTGAHPEEPRPGGCGFNAGGSFLLHPQSGHCLRDPGESHWASCRESWHVYIYTI